MNRRSKPTALSGALVISAGVLQLLYMLTGNRWLVLGAAALAGLVLAGYLFRPDLSAVRVCVGGEHRARAGDPVALTLHVHNDGRRTLPASRLSLVLNGTTQEIQVDVDPVPANGVARATLSPTAANRGAYSGSVASCSATDPLGLLSSRRSWASARELLVQPVAVGPARPVLSSSSAATGVRASVTGTQEVAGLRPWRQGEDLRAVHWRASARRGRTVVVERDVPDVPTRWVLVLVGTPSGPPDEAALALAAATWVDQVRQGHQVSVLAWQGDGSRYPEPDLAPQSIGDWFARIGALAVPGTAQVLEALPGDCDAVTVLASSSTPTGWLDDLLRQAPRQQVRITTELRVEPR